MIDLTTRYMGIELRNPLVVGSCGLTKSVQGVKQAADAGAGAIVLKSLFEEQIAAEIDELAAQSQHSAHTESYDYLHGFGRAFGPSEYLRLVSEAKDAVPVPVIASINCVSAERWTEYATKLADAGADGLELNIGFLPNDPSLDGSAVEERYSQILTAVRTTVDLPVALKIGPYGAGSINGLAENILNQKGLLPPIQRLGHQWYRGRPVLITRNDYNLGLFNGDLGITLPDPNSSSGELYVYFPDPITGFKRFPTHRIAEHDTVFAMTVHKSQGSEFDHVILLLPKTDYPLLTQELIYTGLTRARKSVSIWAPESVLKAAIERRIKRASGLRDALWT